MALGDIYTEKEVDEEIDKLLPVFNNGRTGDQVIPRDTVRAIVRAENMGGSGATTFANRKSNKNATGVMQVIPETVRGLKGKYLAPDFPEDLTDQPLSHQVMAGIATIRELVDRTKTSDPIKLGMYYNGGTEVGEGKRPPSPETQGYTMKMRTAFQQFGTPLPPSPATVQASPQFTTTPLAEARSVFDSVQAMVPALKNALFGGQAQAGKAQQTQQMAIQAGGEAAAASARAQAEITISEQDVHRQLLRAVGLDISDPTSALNSELQREAQTRQTREQLRGKIAERKSINFFQDPLGFMMAQPEIQGMTEEYNQHVDIENRSTSEIARMQTLATNLKALTPAKSADLLRAKASADANAFLEKAKFDAAQISERNAAGNAKLAMDVFTLERNKFQDILNMEARQEGIEQREADRKLRIEQFEMTQLQKEMLRMEKKQKDVAEQEIKQRETALVTGINMFRGAISGSQIPLTPEDVKRMPADVKSAWYEVILRGNYGNTYAQALPFIETFGNVAAAAESGNAGMMLLVRNLNARVEPKMTEIANREKLKNPMISIKANDLRTMAYNELFAADAVLANKGALKDNISPASPYAIDYDAIARAATKSKEQTVVSQVLVDALARNPGRPLRDFSARMMVEEVKARVVAGSVSPAVAAAQLSTFYKNANDQQYQDFGLKYIGLPKFVDYAIRPGSQGEKTVDLYNPTQVENYLTSEVARERRARLIPSSSFGIIR